MIFIEQELTLRIIPRDLINDLKNLYPFDRIILVKLKIYTNINRYIVLLNTINNIII